MTTVNVKRVPAAFFSRAVEDAQVEGWTLESKGDRIAVLTNDGGRIEVLVDGGWGSLFGHTVAFILTAWWTLGLGNLAYALWTHFRATRSERRSSQKRRKKNEREGSGNPGSLQARGRR